MTMEMEYVWGKYSVRSKFWPGKICTPPKINTKPNSKWIYFFGLKKYVWVDELNLKPYLQHRNDIVKTIKANIHKKAIREIDEYMKDPEKYKAHFIENNYSPKASSMKKEYQANTEANILSENYTSKGPIKKKRTLFTIKKEPMIREIIDDELVSPAKKLLRKATKIENTPINLNNDGLVGPAKKRLRQPRKIESTPIDLDNDELVGPAKKRQRKPPKIDSTPIDLNNDELVGPAKKPQRKPLKIDSTPIDINNDELVGPAKKRLRKPLKIDSTPIDLNNDELVGPAKKPQRKPLKIDSTPINLNNDELVGPAKKPQRKPPKIDTNQVVRTSIQKKDVETSPKTFGFLGVGIMGSRIVKNLIKSGHNVIIWNRDPSKSKALKREVGAQVATSPCNLAEQVDIIFACVSDPLASKELVFGNNGIISSANFKGKGYVEMNCLDDNISKNIADAIVSKGGRYLEAKIQGSEIEAEEGSLILLAAGDKSLFNECQSCFSAMGKSSFFLDTVRNVSTMYLLLQSIRGVILGGLAETLALADRLGLLQNVLDTLEETSVASNYLLEEIKAIINQNCEPHQRLLHMQKDLGLALLLAKQAKQPMPILELLNNTDTN